MPNILLICVLTLLSVTNALAGTFELSDRCPIYFELDVNNQCKLISPYPIADKNQFDPLQLPKPRSGFTPQQIDLGRYLFFDPLLSANNDLSCAQCHQPGKGLTDGNKRGQGIEPLSRNTPSLWNVGFLRKLFWDGRASSLEEQSTGPLFSPDEMGSTPTQLAEKINSVGAYRSLFSQAFPLSSSQGKISIDEISFALTAFQSSLISLNSRYDQYTVLNRPTLNEKELVGLRVFTSNCFICHTPPLFTNQEIAGIGVPEADSKPTDPGTQAITGKLDARGTFKIPSLRNISLTAPYMHSGVFPDLVEVVDFYNDERGHAVPEGEKLSLHGYLFSLQLTDKEVVGLLAFLETLSDESALPTIPRLLPSGLDISLD